MFVTLEDLEKYKACEAGKRFFKRIYPNGVEIIDLLNNTHVPKEILHWGYIYLPVTIKEINKYLEVCKIENSKNFINSDNIKFSDTIINSSFVEDSENILYSKNIKESKDVLESTEIIASDSIFYSNKISDSSRALNSKTIIRSNDINSCFSIEDSQCLVNSKNVKASFMGYNLSNCNFVYFSSNMENCDKCIFCQGLKNKNFYIFNEQVDPDLFYLIQYRVFDIFLRAKPSTFIINKNKNGAINAYSENPFFMYQFLSQEDLVEISTLPYFDPFILYQITLLPEVLNIKV